MRKKYFFFDIDGTLTTSSVDPTIPKSTKLALEKLEKAGHFVSIATGRSYPMTLEVLKQTGIKHAVTDGGNGLCINQQAVKIYSLDREGAIEICKECLAKHLLFGVIVENKLAYVTPSEEFIQKSAGCIPDMEVTLDPNFDPTKVENFYKIFIYGDENVEKQLVSRTKLSYMRYHPKMMVFEDDCKFTGIIRMIDYLKAPLEDVVCFGDGKNDLSMFKQAPFSIAMGNAIEKLKDIASYVTDNSDQDGIYKACEHFGWFEKVSE